MGNETSVAADDDEPRPPLWSDPYGDGPRGYPFDPALDPHGYGNPHRGVCKLCGSIKQAVPTLDAAGRYFLARMCGRCDLRGTDPVAMFNMPNMYNTGELIMGRSEYIGYRRRRMPIAPARVLLGCLALAWVCGWLVAGLPVFASLGAALCMALAPCVGSTTPTVGSFVWGGILLLGCAAYAALVDGDALGALWYALPAAAALGCARILAGPPAGRGGPIGRRSGEYPADRRNGR